MATSCITYGALYSDGKFPSDYGRVCGYEVPRYDIVADGFMYSRDHQFCRELNMTAWGGICCYDLRAPAAGAGNSPATGAKP